VAVFISFPLLLLRQLSIVAATPPSPLVGEGKYQKTKSQKKKSSLWSESTKNDNKKGKKKGEVRAWLYPLCLEPRDTTPHHRGRGEP
jgi:hypothetical protein